MDSLEHFDVMVGREKSARIKAGRSPELSTDEYRILADCAQSLASSTMEIGE